MLNMTRVASSSDCSLGRAASQSGTGYEPTVVVRILGLEVFIGKHSVKRQTDKLRREAFGVRRIPALCESSARREARAPEYGALQTLRAIWLLLGPAGDRRALP